MRFDAIELTQTMDSVVTTTYGASLDLGAKGVDSFSVTVVNVDDTPSNGAFTNAEVNTTDDEITIAAHGFTTGLKVQFTTDGTLPTGLSPATDYYIIVVDANTIQVATSYANAIAGTQIDLTAAGSGNDSANPVALSSNLKLQQSNDDLNWADIGSGTNITGAGSFLLSQDRPPCRYMRLALTHTAGQLTSTHYILGKGDK